jgi:nucleotidyltransferase-like protein
MRRHTCRWPVAFPTAGRGRNRITLRPVHQQVEDVVGDYLELVDALADGLVTGLYLEGSVALDDFRPGASDVDAVAVTDTPPDAAALAALAEVHARLRRRHRRPHFDALYLTWADLATGPTAGRPASLRGRFRPVGQTPSPVTWHTLADHGVVVRGPALAGVDLWTDHDALAAWQDRNLDEYWARKLDRATRPGTVDWLLLLTRWGTVWTVTGISRLHHTIATDAITSKAGAAENALREFDDRWRRVVAESLRLRRGEPGRSPYRTRFARRRDVLAFGRMAIADAHRRYEQRGQTS